MLVTGIGALVVVYARYYLSPTDPVPRFFSFFLAFMGAMLGVVLSGNLIQLVFFWELTSLFSFLLIGYWHHRADARRGARMALDRHRRRRACACSRACWCSGTSSAATTSTWCSPPATAYARTRSTRWRSRSSCWARSPRAPSSRSTSGCRTRWRRRRRCRRYLHSATMVKAGVFLLARLWPVLSGTEAWFWIVDRRGRVHAAPGRVSRDVPERPEGPARLLDDQPPRPDHAAPRPQQPARRGGGGLPHDEPRDVQGVAVHGGRHRRPRDRAPATSGACTGSTACMPITGTLALVASAAMAGVPLLNGFLSKEMFFAETCFLSAHPGVEFALPIVATLAGLFAVVYSLRFSATTSSSARRSDDLPREPHEPLRWMRVPIELLVLACLVVGDRAGVVGRTVPRRRGASGGRRRAARVQPRDLARLQRAAGDEPGRDRRRHRWSTCCCSRALDAGRYDRIARSSERLDGRRAFERVARARDGSSRGRASSSPGTRRLQTQMAWLVVAALAAALAAASGHDFGWGDRPRVPASPEFVLLWTIGIACALGAAAQAKFHRLAALTLMARRGPRHLPHLRLVLGAGPRADAARGRGRDDGAVPARAALAAQARAVGRRARTCGRACGASRDLVIAVAAGGGLAALSYAMLTRPAPQSISPFFLARALPEGGGTNVVNVMLVDFRALRHAGRDHRAGRRWR